MLTVDGRQHHVEQQDARPRHLRQRERVESRGGRVDREPEVLEDKAHRFAEVVVVVGHKNAARQTATRLHGAALRRPRAAGRHGNVSVLAAPHERWPAEV
jgi:hypothetical protein